MDKREERRRHTGCSFCGKDQSEVRRLVAGPGVYICNLCIELCNKLLKEDLAPRATSANKSRPFGPRSGWRGWFRNLFAVRPNPARRLILVPFHAFLAESHRRPGLFSCEGMAGVAVRQIDTSGAPA